MDKINDADWLREAYSRRSMQSIADELGVHRNTVRNRLIEFGIERRDNAVHFSGVPKTDEQRRKMSEARKRYWDEHPEEKAILSAKLFKHGLTKGYRRALGTRGKREHRLIMEEAIGRPLLPTETIHHINGIKTDNRLENLMILSPSEHSRLHHQTWEPHPRDSSGRFVTKEEGAA